MRLFCFPFAGGSAFSFRDWPISLPDGVALAAVQLPGREQRITEPPFIRLEPLVFELANALIPYLQTPYVFFGHSMGALLAFEVARELRRRQMPIPAHLLVSAQQAPQLPVNTPAISHLPDSRFIASLKSLGGTAAETLNHTQLRQLLLPTLRADFAVCEGYSYRHEPPLSSAITAYGGLDDPRVSRVSLIDWKQQSTSRFKVRMLPGNHFFIQNNATSFFPIFARDLLTAN